MLAPNKSFVISILIGIAAGLSVHASDSTLDPEDHPDLSVGQSGELVNNSQDTPLEPRPDYTQLRRTVRQYELHIAEMEKKGGAYSEQIGEESIGLGRAYMELGEYKNALEAFDRSLHISRVNHGPDNPKQLPILDLIIEVNTALSDWEALEENYQLLYWTSRRVYKENVTPLLSMLYRIAQWHLNAYVSKFDSIPYKHLLESEKIYHDAVKIIENQFGPDDPRLIQALNGIAISDYHITSHIFNANTTYEMDEIRSSSSIMSRKSNVSSLLVWEPVKYSNAERKKVLVRITRIFNVHPELPVKDQATALVNLGDWYLIYGWRNHALKNYRQAYQLLADTDSDTINEIFGTPVLIPTMTLDIPGINDNADNEKENSYVKLSFEVTDLGCARRIKVIEESDPDNFMARKNAREFLKSYLLRPKFNGVKPVVDRQVVLTLHGDTLKRKTDRKLVNYEQYDGFIATQRCGHLR